MDSYKASKAWHVGHDLAIAVYGLAQRLPDNDEFNLAEHLRRTSAAASSRIAESIERQLEHEKLACYKLAREAVVELQEHLSLARDLQYIEQQVFEELAGKAITAHNLLSGLIRPLAARSSTHTSAKVPVGTDDDADSDRGQIQAQIFTPTRDADPTSN
jgi:four helix bundle protein